MSWWRISDPACSPGWGSAEIDWQSSIPSLVTLSISGFGHDGPEGGRAGYDQIAQGEAGLMSLTGSGPDDPQRVGVPIGDLIGRSLRGHRCAGRISRTGHHPPRPAGAHLLAGQHRRRARIPGNQVDRGRRGRPRPGQPPPVHLAVRFLSLRRWHGTNCGRQRGTVETILCRIRHRYQHNRSGHERRSGRQPRTVIELVERAFAGTDSRNTSQEALRRRDPRREGTHNRRGLRMAADPITTTCSLTSTTRPSAAQRFPDPPCGSSNPRPTVRWKPPSSRTGHPRC